MSDTSEKQSDKQLKPIIKVKIPDTTTAFKRDIQKVLDSLSSEEEKKAFKEDEYRIDLDKASELGLASTLKMNISLSALHNIFDQIGNINNAIYSEIGEKSDDVGKNLALIITQKLQEVNVNMEGKFQEVNTSMESKFQAVNESMEDIEARIILTAEM